MLMIALSGQCFSANWPAWFENRFGNRTPAWQVVLLLWTACLHGATVPQSTLDLAISCPSVPAGGMAQVRIVLAQPHQIAAGSIVMDFDPAIFGPVAAVDVFSATGDQIGVANISDRHVDARFSSPSGGIGRLPGVPAITIEVPVLANAALGVVGSITFTTGATPWKDVLGYQYAPATPSGSMKVGGTVSIDSVTTGGGMLPFGFSVRIAGRGFVPTSTVQIEGVVLASTMFAGPQEIDVTLGGPADLTSKRVVVQNPDGRQADFYSALRGNISDNSPGPLIQPIFPSRTYPGASIGTAGTWFALQNQNPEPVDVTTAANTQSENRNYAGSSTSSLPSGGIYVEGPYFMYNSETTDTEISIFPSAPIRMMLLGPAGFYDGDLATDESPSLVEPIVPIFYPVWASGLPSCSVDPFHGLFPQPACLAWLIGSSPPAPQVLSVTAFGPPTSFTAAVTTTDGGKWLSVSPAQGTTCLSGASTCSNSNLTLKFDPLLLKPGEYTGTLTVTPAASIYPPLVIPLIFGVTKSFISVQGPAFMGFGTDAAGNPSAPQTLQVTSTGDAALFSVSLSISQEIFGNWISVSPMQGTTPATLTVTANPSAFPKGNIAALGYITITGPANSVTNTVTLVLTQLLPPPVPPVIYTSAGNTPLVFWAKAGTTQTPSQFVDVSAYPDSVQVVTDRGGNWLAALAGEDIDNSPGLSVSVNPTGLGAGTYHGTITVGSTRYPDYAPAKVAVILIIWAEPPPISVAPGSLKFSVSSGTSTGSYESGEISAHTLTVTSGGAPVDSTVALSTVDGNNWLTLLQPFSYVPYGVPYGSMYMGADAKNLPPGTYEGTVTITAPPGSPNSVSVPVTLNVTPALPTLPQAGPPFGVSIVNGASQTVGTVAPGEILTVFGQNIGPSTPAGLQLDASGKVATNVSGARVLFNGVPAPIIYASPTQVNAVVPYEVAGEASVTIQVEFNGTAVTVAGVPVVPSAPAIFSADGTGVGQANAFNQDNSANSASNPAARGSIVRLLATGAGQTTPASLTGEFTGNDVKQPLLPVQVEIGNVQATVEDARSAPDQVTGILQLQVLVPQGVAPGPNLPLVLIVGSAHSQGVTIAVR